MAVPKIKKPSSGWTTKAFVASLVVISALFVGFNVDSNNNAFSSSQSPLSSIDVPLTKPSSISESKSLSIQKVTDTERLPKAATPTSAPVIAYAISLIKCEDKQTSTAGLIDAALVLRHSVHMQSIRNEKSGSRYDYQMYAIVHVDAVKCSSILKAVGFTTIIAETPINQTEIKGEHLRNTIHREWCCGHHEFIKLQAFNLVQHPAVVHVDIDFLFLKPMDALYDAIIFDKNSPEGKAARSQIQMERPEEDMPEKINAFITRDWPQVRPGRIPGYQAGFIVLRPDPAIPKELYEIILEGNYTKGNSRENGWGGLGYGSFVGAMAMQGLMAYYYDIVSPNSVVELNQCRYNWMGMDILYRAPPNFNAKLGMTGRCRNDRNTCEQCYETNSKLIHNVHYTQCRKPWNCVGVGLPGGAKGLAIDTNAGSYEKCMEIVTKWHELRSDFEKKFYALTNDERILKAAQCNYKTQLFNGHCAGEGGGNYSQIDASEESFSKIPQMYIR